SIYDYIQAVKQSPAKSISALSLFVNYHAYFYVYYFNVRGWISTISEINGVALWPFKFNSLGKQILIGPSYTFTATTEALGHFLYFHMAQGPKQLLSLSEVGECP
ncbi:hypothetical protein ACJX0J_020306, partial [Zea mays]